MHPNESDEHVKTFTLICMNLHNYCEFVFTVKMVEGKAINNTRITILFQQMRTVLSSIQFSRAFWNYPVEKSAEWTAKFLKAIKNTLISSHLVEYCKFGISVESTWDTLNDSSSQLYLKEISLNVPATARRQRKNWSTYQALVGLKLVI